MAVVCLSVCLFVRLSVCRMPDPKSRMEGIVSWTLAGRKKWSRGWPVTPFRDRKVRCQGYNITSSILRLFGHNSTKKKCRNPKIGWKVVLVSCNGWYFASISKSKGQRSRSPSRLTLWPKISHIFETGRPSNLVYG